MLAYHGDEGLKAQLIAQMEAHRAADEIVQGRFWRGGKGCAVGCLAHTEDNPHEATSELTGFPLPVCHLMETIFEGLSVNEAKEFPLQVLHAVPVGKDFSGVTDRFTLFVLQDVKQYADEATLPCIQSVIDLYHRKVKGEEPLDKEWSAAESAAWAAESAAWAAGAARAKYRDEFLRLLGE